VNPLDVLRQEFHAEEGSFLLTLRTEYHWDRAAFTRLEQAMRLVAAGYASRDQLARWLADGYYYVSTYVPAMTQHPDFQRPTPDSYYEACIKRLHQLATWFFSGQPFFRQPHTWEPL
jgi:hypothetical protein